MIDLSKFSTIQRAVLESVSDFECGDLQCDDCPFYNNGNCISLELSNMLFNERRERDKD